MVYVLSLLGFQLHISSCGVCCSRPVRPARCPKPSCEEITGNEGDRAAGGKGGVQTERDIEVWKEREKE